MARRADVILEEILHAIEMIENVASGYDRAGFEKAEFQQRGIERLLEIISEAVRHLPDDLLALRPEIAWADIRGIGNLIRHEYWRTDSHRMVRDRGRSADLASGGRKSARAIARLITPAERETRSACS